MSDATENFFANGGTITDSAIVATFCPLVVSGEGWSLSFQSMPESKIILRGQRPSREDLIMSLSCSALPVLMVSICEICLDIQERIATLEAELAALKPVEQRWEIAKTVAENYAIAKGEAE